VGAVEFSTAPTLRFPPSSQVLPHRPDPDPSTKPGLANPIPLGPHIFLRRSIFLKHFMKHRFPTL
jgi:hypothetical protein